MLKRKNGFQFDFFIFIFKSYFFLFKLYVLLINCMSFQRYKNSENFFSFLIDEICARGTPYVFYSRLRLLVFLSLFAALFYLRDTSARLGKTREKNRRLCDLTDSDTPRAGERTLFLGIQWLVLADEEIARLAHAKQPSSNFQDNVGSVIKRPYGCYRFWGTRFQKSRDSHDQGYILQDKNPNRESHNCYTCQK